MDSFESSASNSRAERYVSHALVELRRFRSLPILSESGVLLDISLGGFKAEFTGETATKPGKRFWLVVPLGPLGIIGPSQLAVRVEVRWFDEKRRRLGGVFLDLTRIQQHIIRQVIETLESRGNIISS